jgi:hypothetical protein
MIVMRAAFAILSLLSVFSVAGDEITSLPLPPRNALMLPIATPALAIAHDRDGVVIAWTARGELGLNRISIARLDSHGYVAGSIHEVPVSSSEAGIDANYPSIAMSPSGSGFTLAWMELLTATAGGDVRVMYCRLGADLTPSAASVLAWMKRDAVTSPVIVRSGEATWLAANNEVWKLRSDGTHEAPLETGLASSDMIANAPFPRLVAGGKAFTTTGCAPSCFHVTGGPFHGYCDQGPACTVTFGSGYALQLVSIYSRFESASFTFESDAQPAIQSDGRDVLIAWERGTQKFGGLVVVNRLDDRASDFYYNVPAKLQVVGTFGADTGRIRPDIATDGSRYVIVWDTKTLRGDHDVIGAMLDPNGTVTPFDVATSTADEREPSIISIRPGAFLVAYEKIGVDRRIAGRFITFDGRERAVR